MLDLGPHDEPGQRQQFLHLRELGEEVWIDVGSVLVAVVQIIAPRRDHMVGGDPDVRGPVANEIEHSVEHPAVKTGRLQELLTQGGRKLSDVVFIAETFVGNNLPDQ